MVVQFFDVSGDVFEWLVVHLTSSLCGLLWVVDSLTSWSSVLLCWLEIYLTQHDLHLRFLIQMIHPLEKTKRYLFVEFVLFLEGTLIMQPVFVQHYTIHPHSCQLV